jgi:protein O-mannosyl-transferase
VERTLSTRLIALLVFVVACAGMARVCANDFVSWDDSFTLFNNPRMNPPTAETLRFYWTRAEHGLYMPGTQTIWAALAKVARNDRPSVDGVWLNPRVFHVASVAFHATAALVMFLLLRRLIGAARDAAHAQPSIETRFATDVAAAIGALLFALHPVQVESVAWTAGMKDVLYGLFALVALWQYVAAVQASSRGAARRTVLTHFTFATAAFVWAVLCKPTAMVVPALAAVLHVVVMRRNWREAARWTAAWWPITLAAMVVARLSQQVTDQVATPPLWVRPLIAGDALAFYAAKLLWPLKLCIDYGRSPIVAHDGGWVYWTWLVPAAIAGVLVWRPRRELVAAALLVCLCVAPVLGLTRFMFQFYSTVSDHYLYLAMLGPALAAAWLAMNHPKFARPAALVLIGLFAVKSFAQAGTWKDDESLFTHTLAVTPTSPARTTRSATRMRTPPSSPTG